MGVHRRITMSTAAAVSMTQPPENRSSSSIKHIGNPVDEPFGAVLGIAPGGVPAYSCDYDTWQVPRGQREWRNTHEGVFTGAKWQCVEFARRWLLVNYGYTFSDIPMAYHIMQLNHVTMQTGPQSGEHLPLFACHNGGPVKPQVGSMLIWDRSYDQTGHVAIITEVGEDYVRIAEQNFEDWKWVPGADYARELRTTTDHEVRVTVHDEFLILGWMVQTDVDPNAVPQTLADSNSRRSTL